MRTSGTSVCDSIIFYTATGDFLAKFEDIWPHLDNRGNPRRWRPKTTGGGGTLRTWQSIV